MSDLSRLRDVGDLIVPPPLDSLRETARVRNRRSRTVTVAAAAVAVAVIASFAYRGGLPEDNAAPEPIGPPDGSTTRPLSYADGDTVHYGDRTITAAGVIKELDVTDTGVGFRTADGGIWFTDGSTPVELGSVGEPPAPFTETERGYAIPPGWLVSGNTGSRLAWFDFTQPDAPEIVVHDTQTGETVARTEVAVPAGQLAYPFSIHDDAAYWMVEPPEGGPPEEEPVPDMRLDLATGVSAPVSPEEYLAELEVASPERTFRVSHAERGFKLASITEGLGHQFGVYGAQGRLDPEGGQPIEVRDGATGTQLGLHVPEGYESTGPLWVVQWLADDRLVLWQWPSSRAATGDKADVLLECPVPIGTCTVAASGPSASFVVPVYG